MLGGDVVMERFKDGLSEACGCCGVANGRKGIGDTGLKPWLQ